MTSVQLSNMRKPDKLNAETPGFIKFSDALQFSISTELLASIDIPIANVRREDGIKLAVIPFLLATQSLTITFEYCLALNIPIA